MRCVGKKLVLQLVGFLQLLVERRICIGMAKILLEPVSGKADNGHHNIKRIVHGRDLRYRFQNAPQQIGHNARSC
ncbi:hypothetical protein D3C80_1185880 [compost metagenome]